MEEIFQLSTLKPILQFFRKKDWKKLVQLLINYSCITLQSKYNIINLSLDEISSIVKEASESTKDKKDIIKEKLNKTKDSIELEDDFHSTEEKPEAYFPSISAVNPKQKGNNAKYLTQNKCASKKDLTILMKENEPDYIYKIEDVPVDQNMTLHKANDVFKNSRKELSNCRKKEDLTINFNKHTLDSMAIQDPFRPNNFNKAQEFTNNNCGFADDSDRGRVITANDILIQLNKEPPKLNEYKGQVYYNTAMNSETPKLNKIHNDITNNDHSLHRCEGNNIKPMINKYNQVIQDNRGQCSNVSDFGSNLESSGVLSEFNYELTRHSEYSQKNFHNLQQFEISDSFKVLTKTANPNHVAKIASIPLQKESIHLNSLLSSYNPI